MQSSSWIFLEGSSLICSEVHNLFTGVQDQKLEKCSKTKCNVPHGLSKAVDAVKMGEMKRELKRERRG